MSNDKNISNLIKKKVLSFGSKPSPASKTVTSKVEAPKPKEVKPAKVKPRKVKTVKAQQAPQQAQQQPYIQLSDFSLSTDADSSNIYVITRYQDQVIHIFNLPSSDYQVWQRASFQLKYSYVFSKTDITAFNNDIRILQAAVIKTIQILDSIFSWAQARQLRHFHYDL